jgi:agmatine deiminase
VLKIVHFPVPEPIVTPHTISSDEITFFQQQDPALLAGDVVLMTATASYLNYVISNGVIIMPAYWREGQPEQVRLKDELARSIMEHYFPNRLVIQLDPTSLNLLGGGMHCITMQQPMIQH